MLPWSDLEKCAFLINDDKILSAQLNFLGDSQMPLILLPSSAKRIATHILVTAKLNGKKDFILRVFVCDIVLPSKELPVQS